MTRIRVLRLIARMNVGGPALQVAGLVEGLDPDRYETVLVTGHTAPGEADFLDLHSYDLPVRRIGELGRSIRPGDDLRAFKAVAEEIRSFRPHIVHTHTAKAGALGRIAARFSNSAHTVHTFHGHLLHGYFSRPGTLAVKMTERALARRTDRLFAVGGRVRDELLEAGIGRPDQYVVMPPGIPPPRRHVQEEARRTFELGSDDLVVSYVARLTEVKRPDRFIEAASHLARTNPRVRFLIAGEGPLLDRMKRDAAILGERCYFLGWVEDVGQVYAASDLVMLTSDNEGMPVSLIEAAMCGVPAVSTNVGSANEVVLDGRTGLVTRRDPVALADAANTLLSDDEKRIRFGRTARQHARERFSVERLVADTATVYEELVATEIRAGA